MTEKNEDNKDAIIDQALSQLCFQIEMAATNAKCAKLFRDKIAKNNRILDYVMLLILVILLEPVNEVKKAVAPICQQLTLDFGPDF